jgi:hypothetical protein
MAGAFKFSSRSFSDVTEKEILCWISTPETRQFLEDLKTGKTTSWRHDIFESGGRKKKAKLRFQGSNQCLRQGKLRSLATALLKEFASADSDLQAFGYTMDVLFPEVTLKLLMDLQGVSYDEAECSIKAWEFAPTPTDDAPGLLAAEGFQRGLSLQRSLRGSSGFSESLTLRVCPMGHSRKGYVRCGDYVEVRVPKTASYAQVVSLALEVLDVEEDEEDEGEAKPSMFRIDGTMVPDSPVNNLPWTVTRYLKSLRKSAGQLKLGVGFYYKGSTSMKSISKSSFKTIDSRPSSLSKSTDNSPSASFTSAPSYPPRSSRKRKLGNREGHVTVLYAPDLGVAGLDTEDVKSRFEVYRIEYHVAGDEPSTVQRDMDETIPFYPEIVCYRVFSITVDDKCILRYNTDGTFSVMQPSSSLGHFQVTHQSPPNVYLPEEEQAVALYCVASNHTVLHSYQWENSGEALSGSTPVLWVNKEGIYKCTVKESEDSSSPECSSREISVHAFQGTSSGDCKITRVDGPISPPSLSSQMTPSASFVKGDAMIFSFDDLSKVTNNFSKEKMIGKGGFGRVFHGKLRYSDVAVKVLNTRGMQSIMRAESECLLNTEVAALTRYRHPNLIALMGYCKSKPILVYPYMQRESLFKNLHEWKVEEPLTWVQRLSILTDTCRGLAYLHSEQPPVIHHDVNSSNILLDHKLTAKISDFGFSIQLPQSLGSKTLITSADGLPGTDGYRPPEYSDRKYSVLSDMYSFGVVALECYTGLLPFSDEREGNNLVDHTEEDRANVDTFIRVSDVKLGPCPVALLTPLLDIVNQCTKRISKRRLPSSEVIDILEGVEV